jgi:hypothetical protein
MRLVPVAAALALALAASGASPADDAPAAASDPAADWKALSGAVPFLLGRDAGRAESEFSGRPYLFFYAARGCAASLRMAATAFRDPGVAKAAAEFVPVLVDAGGDKGFAKEFGVGGAPAVVFADPSGRVAGRVDEVLEPAEFLAALRAARRRIGYAPLKKAARDLRDAAEALEEARAGEKPDWRAALRAAAAIEGIGHEGREMEAARKARKDAIAESGKRLRDAKRLRADGKPDEARAEFRRIAREFEGLDAAVEARNLLKEMDEAPGTGGDDGGGDDDDKGKGGKHGPGSGRRGGRSHPRD